MHKSKKLTLSHLLFLMLSTLLVSCSPASDSGSGGEFSSLTGCEYLYEDVFISTFHNFVRTAPRTCISCHDDPGISHQFALLDAELSFENFLLMSNLNPGSGRATHAKDLLRANALDPSHNSAGSLAYLTDLDSFEASWDSVNASYSDCVASF